VTLSSSILQRVADGEPSALKQCVDDFGPLVWSLARRLSRTSADAEDAVQEIFLDLWRSAGRYDPAKASETTFVAMIARRRLIDRLRKGGQEADATTALADVPEPRAEGHDALERRADAAIAARAVRSLKDEQRRFLQLSVFRGMTHSEIAEATGTPLGTVKSHIRRGLLLVREKLGAERPAPGGSAPR
jgi:RNA polymerase sigma-70 factor (ECF subfamily)